MTNLIKRNLKFLLPGYWVARAMGIDPLRFSSVFKFPRYLGDVRAYQEQNPSASFRIRLKYLRPIVADWGAPAGGLDDYFHQDLWAARKIYERRPSRHVDIGSRLDGFVAHVLVFMTVEYVDIRRLSAAIHNLKVTETDATLLETFPDGSVPSISSLNVAEHFGLGRYSDPINPFACFQFMKSLARVLAPGGRLYFSTPIGHERVEFNAHRVFAVKSVLSGLTGLNLVSFSYVRSGLLHEDVQINEFPEDAEYACGLFEFTKAP